MWTVGGRVPKGLCGVGQGLRDPCPVGPSCRCLDELPWALRPGLERGCQAQQAGEGGERAGRWEWYFILSPGGLAPGLCSARGHMCSV